MSDKHWISAGSRALLAPGPRRGEEGTHSSRREPPAGTFPRPSTGPPPGPPPRGARFHVMRPVMECVTVALAMNANQPRPPGGRVESGKWEMIAGVLSWRHAIAHWGRQAAGWVWGGDDGDCVQKRVQYGARYRAGGSLFATCWCPDL